MEVDATDSGSCPVTIFSNIDVKLKVMLLEIERILIDR
jgi:hypothetical protein